MWSKLDDQFPDHPKVMKAGPLASWLYVCGTCYCNRLLTDGHIPLAQVRKLADVDDALGLAAILVEVGLWEQAEGGYQIHDFLDHNMSAEEAKARKAEIRQIRSEAGSKGAAVRWQNDGKDSKSDGKLPPTLPSTVDSKPHGKTMAPNPNPLRTISTDVEIVSDAPTQDSSHKPQKSEPAPRKTSLPKGFGVTGEMDEWARAHCPTVDIETATEEWLDYIRTRSIKSADWDAEWRKGMRNAVRFAAERAGKANGSKPAESRFASAARTWDELNRLAGSETDITDTGLFLGPGPPSA